MIIKIERTKKDLSATGGLVMTRELIKALGLQNSVAGALPSLKSGNGRSWRKFLNLVLGFQAGADCLDDMDRLAQDAGFQATCDGKVYSSKADADFLRSFTGHHLHLLGKSLIALGYRLRSELFPDQKSITMNFDSTSNQQYGKKTEGVGKNYKGVYCLDTYQVFDEHGVQFIHYVRPGGTFTSKDCSYSVHDVFDGMPKTKAYKDIRRYARADSGFCNSQFFNACAAKSVGFVVAMREPMYERLIEKVTHWQPQNPNKDNRILFHDGRDCEIGETIYHPVASFHTLRVVLIRAVKEGREAVLFKQKGDYEYHAWVSNIGEHEMSAEKLILFYRGRGNCENHIKELKYGYDLKHYPCLKLVANKAYGLIAAFAHNLMRFFALKDNPRKPQYAKAIRFRFIHLPVEVVRHGRQVVFRFMDRHYEEVQRWISMINNLQSVAGASVREAAADAL